MGISGWADSCYGIGPAAYSFINVKSWNQPSYLRVVAPPAQNIQIIRQTTNITNIRIQNTIINNFGPKVETVGQWTNQKIVPTKIVFNPNHQAGYGAAVRGSELQVVAPAEKLRAVSKSGTASESTRLGQSGSGQRLEERESGRASRAAKEICRAESSTKRATAEAGAS